MTSPASREVLRVRLVRGIDGFDLVVTGCLAVPPFARGFLALLFGADAPDDPDPDDAESAGL